MSISTRFWRSIRRRDWGAAIIDVGVVAIGILMALAVDDWRSDQERDVRAEETLHRAHEQVAFIQSLWVDQVIFASYFQDALYDVRRLAFKIPPDRPISSEECTMVLAAYGSILPAYSTSVVEDLTSSDVVLTVADAAVRSSAIEFVDAARYAFELAKINKPAMINLASVYPELISTRLHPTDDPEDRDGLFVSADCDLDGMKDNKRFLADLNQNVLLSLSVVEQAEEAFRALSSLHKALDGPTEY